MLAALACVHAATDMYAAISLVDLDALPPTLNPTIGAVAKHAANPLLIQDTPWEPRLDNGCTPRAAAASAPPCPGVPRALCPS